MEQTLKQLLDYQRFAGNRRLGAILADAESRYATALSDDDLEWVSAAGEAAPKPEDDHHDA